MFKLKRVDEEPSPGDRFRVLVERLWPGASARSVRAWTCGSRTWPRAGAAEMVQPRPGQVEGVPGSLHCGTQGQSRRHASAEGDGQERHRHPGVRRADEEHNGALVLKRVLEQHKK